MLSSNITETLNSNWQRTREKSYVIVPCCIKNPELNLARCRRKSYSYSIVVYVLEQVEPVWCLVTVYIH
jgi:hypothetical protein